MISSDLRDAIKAKIQDFLPQVREFRHICHQHPERTWEEVETSSRVAKKLEAIDGLELETGVGKYGVVGLLKGGQPGPVVALRADMDALPLDELNSLPYKSKNQGTMHACGHDGHMANLYGTALVLSHLREHIRGTVKFIFQPAEEGGAGADRMCDDGVLENPKVDVIFGMHGWPEAKSGSVWVKDGPLMAANSQFKIVVRGVGCHAAMPHLGTDQVLVAARIIDSLQSVSSRSIAPTEPIALTIAKIQAGTAHNIIPREVTLEGTLRTVSDDSYQRVEATMKRMVAGICEAHGVEGDLSFQPIYPETRNHTEPTDFVENVASACLGLENFKRIEAPSMGAEDFSFYLKKVPGCFFFLGLDDGRVGGYPALHHPEFDYNDDVLPVGIELFSTLALAYESYKG